MNIALTPSPINNHKTLCKLSSHNSYVILLADKVTLKTYRDRIFTTSSSTQYE